MTFTSTNVVKTIIWYQYKRTHGIETSSGAKNVCADRSIVAAIINFWLMWIVISMKSDYDNDEGFVV
jgi:hypothetical protein